MDGASTLVLEGRVDSLLTFNVTDSATLDGRLVLRISLPPGFTSYGVWQNYTIMTCNYQCHGKFVDATVEHDGDCGSIANVREFRERESSLIIAVSFDKSPICFASTFIPSLMFCGLMLLLQGAS